MTFRTLVGQNSSWVYDKIVLDYFSSLSTTRETNISYTDFTRRNASLGEIWDFLTAPYNETPWSCCRCAHDVPVPAEIGGPQAHHLAQINVAGRQDVSADLRMLAAARQSIRGGDTFAGASCTLVRIHRALQALCVFLISHRVVRICEEHCFKTHYVHLRRKIRVKRYRSVSMLLLPLLIIIPSCRDCSTVFWCDTNSFY